MDFPDRAAVTRDEDDDDGYRNTFTGGGTREDKGRRFVLGTGPVKIPVKGQIR